MNDLPLRERSKLRRHAVIAEAAARLFAEQGYDATTVAQVADAAEVAPRTVTLYFPTKLHLATAYASASACRLVAAMKDRSPGDKTVDVMRRWLRAEYDDHGDALELHRAMVATNPALGSAQNGDVELAWTVVGASLAADLGRPDDDPVVRVVGGAFAGLLAALVQLGADDALVHLDLAAKILRSAVRTGAA